MSYTRVTLGAILLVCIGIALISLNDSNNSLSEEEESLPASAVVSSSSISKTIQSTRTSLTEASVPATTKERPQTVLSFTKETLAKYNGVDPSLPIYIAFEGTVYDVTAGKTFYEPGGAYDFLAGTDGTELLHIAGGEIIKKKYPVMGIYVTE